MPAHTMWWALACMLVIEGLMPLLFPALWRSMLEKALRLTDGQIRFFGLGSLLAGLVFMWVLGL